MIDAPNMYPLVQMFGGYEWTEVIRHFRCGTTDEYRGDLIPWNWQVFLTILAGKRDLQPTSRRFGARTPQACGGEPTTSGTVTNRQRSR